MDSFKELVAPNAINHSAPAGAPNGPESFTNFIIGMLRTGLTGITVTIHDQLAEGPLVTTRKTIHGQHTGTFLGIPATGKQVAIQVIDIIRLENNQYAEHWGQSNLGEVMAGLSA